MGFFQQMITALPTVATSWQAVTGYVAVAAAFVIVSLKVTRNKNLLSRLQSLPERDRARVLQMEMGASYLATGLSAEQWLQQQRQRFYFLGFLAACVLTVALVLAAMLSEPKPNPRKARQAAENVAQDFLAKLEAHNFPAAYDLFPEDVRKNISFAQFKAEADRLLFQLPQSPLKDSIEQVVDNGGFLTVVVTSEFSVDTKVRHIIGFAKDGERWKLWTYNWQPVEWPLIWPSGTETRPSAADARKAYLALSEDERSKSLPDGLRGNVTGQSPGWKLVVKSVAPDYDKQRCTIATTEQSSLVAVDLKRVVGGCTLHPGSRVVVSALIGAVNSARIELEAARFFPEL